MSQMILYIFPLILGRTFDYNQMQVGVDIFPVDQLNNTREFNFPSTSTSYKIISNSGDAQSLLYDASHPFRLNAKAGLLKSGVVAEYLQDKFDRRTTVEIVLQVKYITLIEEIVYDAQPITAWNELPGLGTHYVQNIVYGGELIASIRMKCNDTRNKQRLLDNVIPSQNRGFGREDHYSNSLPESVESTEIKVFSSVPLKKIPKDMASLKTMLSSGLVDAMHDYNGGKGGPLQVGFRPLSNIDQSMPAFNKNYTLGYRLSDFEDKFDDLLDTKNAVNDWMKILTQPLSEEGERKIGEFYGNILHALRLFYDIIGKLDLRGGPEQLNPVFEEYGDSFSRSFYRQYMRLKQEIEAH